MPKNIFSRVQSRSLTRHHKIAMAGVATLGAAAIGFSAVPSGASTKTTTEAAQPAAVAYSNQQIKDVKASVTDQMAGASLKAEQIAAKKKADPGLREDLREQPRRLDPRVARHPEEARHPRVLRRHPPQHHPGVLG